jgi:TRAP-type C4-dicarboxylate transport system substrate-binding protein
MLKKISNRLVTSAILVLVGSAFVFPAAAAKYTMKLAIVVANDPLHEFIRGYGKLIEKKSGGQIEAKLFPSAQLGKVPRLIEGLQLGTVEFFGTPTGFLKGIDLRFQVLEVPGVFNSPLHAHKTITDPAFRTPFLRVGEKKGVTGVSLWMYGPTSYATLKPVRTLGDFKGRKFRVLATNVEVEIMKRLGATGVPMPYSETQPALQRGMIDGVRSNITVMNATKHHTVAKFITVVNDTYIPCAGFVSMAWLKTLPKGLQKAVRDAGREVEDFMYKTSQDFGSRAEDGWRKAGAEVIRLSASDQKKFMDTVKPIGDDILGKKAYVKEMFELMKKTSLKYAGS